ncbi:MAG: hypothetical protein V4662_11920 [Verrucomicrobiota bacterium]
MIRVLLLLCLFALLLYTVATLITSVMHGPWISAPNIIGVLFSWILIELLRSWSRM